MLIKLILKCELFKVFCYGKYCFLLINPFNATNVSPWKRSKQLQSATKFLSRKRANSSSGTDVSPVTSTSDRFVLIYVIRKLGVLVEFFTSQALFDRNCPHTYLTESVTHEIVSLDIMDNVQIIPNYDAFIQYNAYQ